MSQRSHAIEAYFQSGARQHAAGRLAEAEQVFREILVAEPTHADSLHMLGVVALQSSQPQAAIACIDQAIALRPSVARYHVNRASALLAQGEMEAALAGCREALRLKRDFAEAYQMQGHILCDLGRPIEAITSYHQALRHNKNLPDLHNNLGLALRHAGRLKEAVGALQLARKRAPQDEQVLSNLGGVLKESARLDEAEAQYRAALRLRPGDPMLHFNLAIVLLLAGRLAEGWDEYEWRFKAGVGRLPACSQPLWRGEPLAGRTLLVSAEQGLGDTIQFCRYVPMIAAGERVVLEVQPQLTRFLGNLPGVTQVVAIGDTLPQFDLYCPLLSLPRLNVPPAVVPYLTAETSRVAAWRERLGPNGFKVGIVWQGNPSAPAERGRSVPLKHFLPLAHVPGVRLISLQKQDGLEQLAALPADVTVETLGPDFDADPDAFNDAAAVMQILDLVILSDTSVAHLAGALGRPVWLALQDVPDWRWMLDRSDSPWYPTMRLFRQRALGDWTAVFAEIAQQLAAIVP